MIAVFSTYKIAGFVFGVVSGAVSGAVFVLAVIDPAIPVISVALMGSIVSVLTLWFGFRTARLVNERVDKQESKQQEQGIKVAEIVKTTDGLKTELVNAVERAARAEGKLKAIADQQTINAAEARGAASLASSAVAEKPTDGTAKSLDRIDTNTAKIAQNTAQTVVLEVLSTNQPT